MAGRGKQKMKAFEAKDRGVDRKAGVKEGTSRDTRLDQAGPSKGLPKPKKGRR